MAAAAACAAASRQASLLLRPGGRCGSADASAANLFLAALSVLPGRRAAISVQRLPRRWCAASRVASSEGDQPPRLPPLTEACSACQRRRHCLLFLEPSSEAT